jgi:hypothetical protein
MKGGGKSGVELPKRRRYRVPKIESSRVRRVIVLTCGKNDPSTGQCYRAPAVT